MRIPESSSELFRVARQVELDEQHAKVARNNLKYAVLLLANHPVLAACAPGAHDPSEMVEPCDVCVWVEAVRKFLNAHGED